MIDFTIALVVGLEGEIEEVINVYPNPFETEFVVDFSSSESFDYQIISAGGSQILEEGVLQSNDKFGNDLPVGVYILKLSNDSGKTSQVKLVKD